MKRKTQKETPTDNYNKLKIKDMQIMYEVEDGYAGGKRPQYIEVDDQDLEDCGSNEEREKLIDECVQAHFSERIYPVWDRKQLK